MTARARGRALLAALALGASACGGAKLPGLPAAPALPALPAFASLSSAPAAPAPPAGPPLQLEVRAGRETNQGGPLYVVVRRTDGAAFLAEDYDAIADGLFRAPRDPALLRRAILRPGEVVRMEVPRALAPGEVLGLYFLFSRPLDGWRLVLTDPQLRSVTVVLGAREVSSVELGR